MSYLDEDSQRDVVEQIDINDCTPSHDQTIRMRKMFESGKLTAEAVEAIMSEEKPNQRERIVLRGDRVRSLIPKNVQLKDTEDYVCKLWNTTPSICATVQSVTADRKCKTYFFDFPLSHTLTLRLPVLSEKKDIILSLKYTLSHKQYLS